MFRNISAEFAVVENPDQGALILNVRMLKTFLHSTQWAGSSAWYLLLQSKQERAPVKRAFNGVG